MLNAMDAPLQKGSRDMQYSDNNAFGTTGCSYDPPAIPSACASWMSVVKKTSECYSSFKSIIFCAYSTTQLPTKLQRVVECTILAANAGYGAKNSAAFAKAVQDNAAR